MVEPAQDRPHHDSHITRQTVAGERDCGQPGWWRGEPRAETCVGTAAIGVDPPLVENASQVVFTE